MRRHHVNDAELVLDNTVCGTNDRDRNQPWACHAILPSILPRGLNLTVWVTRDAGRTWWQTIYRGTGESSHTSHPLTGKSLTVVVSADGQQDHIAADRACLDLATTQNAIREYTTTGARPTGITWTSP